jgi:UDP-N-acetylmuramoylalanine--D-glutamate ligase
LDYRNSIGSNHPCNTQTEIMSQRLTILGAGESGVGAARLAMQKGWKVFLSDAGTIKEVHRAALQSLKMDFEEGTHSIDRILQCDLVVKSPGIPDKAEVIKKLKAAGIPVISEIEFAYRYNNAKIIAITGSNGKTTTTLLTHHILKNAGINVGLAGNIGKSFAAALCEPNPKDWYVLELSSFQLDGVDEFKADIAILTNITPDHLDRYGYSLEAYADSKFRITRNQTPLDYFIYCADDEVIEAGIVRHNPQGKKLPFSLSKPIEEGATIKNENLMINLNNNPFTMSIHELALQGKHNAYNSMAAGIASRVLEIRKELVRESLSDFQNIEHRLEFVAKVHGITFINDSKATNVNSTWYALESFDQPVIWIVGGVDKGNDYQSLKALVKQKVKGIICLGKDNTKILEAYSDLFQYIPEVSSADEAVKFAYQMGAKDDVVLLSPACASFDLFENYEDRGQQFKRAVKAL